MTTNKKVLQFVDEAVALAKPDKVVWIDGSEAQLEALRKEAIASGEMIKLNDEKLPGCLYHRTKPNDVRYPVVDGRGKQPVCENRYRNHRQHLRCPEYGDYDQNRSESP